METINTKEEENVRLSFTASKEATSISKTIKKPIKTKIEALLLLLIMTSIILPTKIMGQWIRVTDISELTAGGSFVIGYQEDAGSRIIIPMQNKGTATTTKAGYLYSGAEPNNSTETTIDMDEISETSDFEFTITENSLVSGAINIKIGDYYLGNENTQNNCKLFLNESVNTAFSPTIDENGIITLAINDNQTYNKLQYNKTTPRFAVYGGTQKNVSIFRKQSEPVPPATYSITYSINGVIDATIQPQSIVIGEEISELPTTSTLSPEGFEIIGWTSSEGNISLIETPFTPESDMTLYAVLSRGRTIFREKVTIVSGSTLPDTETTNTTTQTIEGYSYTFSQGAKKTSVPSTAQNHFTNSEAILIGKNGAFIYNTTPFEYGITKLEIYSKKGASEKVSVAVCFSSEEITEFIDEDNTWKSILYKNDSVYEVTKNIQSETKFFRYQVTNSYNSQIQFRITYLEPDTEYFTRVFTNEVASSDIIITGPSIITAGFILDMGTYELECDNADNLIIEDGAQLILSPQQSTGEATVMATIQKNIIQRESTAEGTPVSGWYLISSPIQNKPFKEINNLITPTPSDYDLFEYDESTITWKNTKSMSDPISETSNGYLYSNASDVTIEYKGKVFSDATTTFTATKTGESCFSGFNLVGNPYCENLPWHNIISDNEEALSAGYYTLNNDGGFMAKANYSNDDIKPCQGFLVQVSEPTTLIITKPDNNRENKTREDISSGKIKIKVANTKFDDYAYAMIGEGQGLRKIAHFNKEIPNIYIPQGDEKYAIAHIGDSVTTIPVNFKAGTLGRYQLSIETDNDYLHLIDNANGNETDMLLCPSYEFTASPEDEENRFTLRVKNASNAIHDDVFIYQSGNELIATEDGIIVIFDILGRPVIVHNENSRTINAEGLKAGIYFVTIKGNQNKTQKIIIR
ncbi:MAG: T9SS type A sorting domain-containing protein [Candidatus Limimorpha sp.]